MRDSSDPTAPAAAAPGPRVATVPSDVERRASRRPWHGRMLEDAAIELSTFRPGGRVFAIASAGCTAMALARRGDRVTAVDVHPGQIDLVRARMAGDDPPPARVDSWLAEGRRRLQEKGTWDDRAIETFLRTIDLDVQCRSFRDTIFTRPVRALTRAALARPRLAGDRAGFPTGWTPDRFGARVERRLARCVATHPNRWNPYLWWLLAGRDAPGTRSGRAVPPDGLSLHVADACQWLEANPDARFDGFSLSNVLDGASPGMRARLAEAVRRVAEPRAVVVVRSLEEPTDPFAAWGARRDRSGIWGGVRAVPVSQFEG